MGTEFFQYYSLENAQSVTLTGQYIIKSIERGIDEYLNNILKTENVSYVEAIDTDSVAGDSEIAVNNNKITIESFYNKVSSSCNFIKNDIIDENYIVDLGSETWLTPSVSDKQIKESKRIKYISKHKVTKEMFRIKYKDKHVDVTEDHSIIVRRNDMLISVKPRDIQFGDEIAII